jgi:hypothetical protein
VRFERQAITANPRVLETTLVQKTIENGSFLFSWTGTMDSPGK